MSRATVELEEPTCRIVAERNVVVAVWRDAPTVSQVRAVGRVGRARRVVHQDGIVLVNVIVSGTPSFPEEVRAEIKELYRANHFALGACHVVLVPGLAGVATRAFLGTVSLLRRTNNPSRIVGDRESAVLWLLECATSRGEPWKRAELVELLDRAQAAV